MNASAPLAISTYDGVGQTVHPDVVFVPGRIGGYEYWIATTPYPNARDRFENPSIRASHDGYVWELPAGVPDPVVDAPTHPDEHHADPDLVFADGLLHLTYMTTNEKDRVTRFSVIRSVDGRKWSSPRVIYEGAYGVSPAVLVRPNRWDVWHVDYDTSRNAGDARLLRRTGVALESLGAAQDCILDIPGHVLWHIDVIADGHDIEALLAAFPRGSTSSRCRLFHATSHDGVTFTLTKNEPILRPSRLGWDNRVIYRSCFLKDAVSGVYRVWYTGGSWSRTWGIGYLEGDIQSLAPSPHARTQSRASSMHTDALGLVRYIGGRLLPKPIVEMARRIIDR